MNAQNPNKKIFDHKAIEEKWRKVWKEANIYKTREDKDKKKFYVLDMFPYPSGAGLHVGHPKGYIATDIISRYKRMQGYNVLHPMGWDAFGLPAEQHAIKTKTHPAENTRKNIETFKSQLEKIFLNYDWEREISTTDPEFYKWTQWAFIQMFKKGLVYESNEPINWCPSCKTGLANEDLEGGKCERCGSEIEKKPIRQWVIRITDYADRLLDDLDKLDWQEHIKELQRNWIGRSYGAEIDFPVKGRQEQIKVFTTRPDTIFGATYMVLAPEHELVQKWLKEGAIENKEEVENYIQEAKKKSEIERTNVEKEKSGVELKGIKAINTAREKADMDDIEIPVFIADYVLAHYGTGAIMAVPAHDERDFDFAKKYGLPVPQVIECGELPCAESGKLINSAQFDGLSSEEAKQKIVNWLAGKDKMPEFQNEPMKEGVPTEERDNISVILYDPEADKYAFLKWADEIGWKTPIGGGVKDGESLVEAAKREIKEESGYTDVEFVSFTTDHITKGYAKHKNINRVAYWYGLYFELKSKEQEVISESEKQKHELVWLKEDEAKDLLNTEGSKYHWEQFLKLKKEGGLNKKYHPYARMTKTYRLRDWVFARQRYWGEPIPLVHCEKCGVVPVPEEELPLTLPEVESYEPTGTGESPLAAIDEWVNTKCPKCGADAKRETNTMPQWAGSSWYYLRYIDPHNDKELVNKEKEKYWSPVDLYVGGAEHATRHLIYARFWHKFLYDIGVVNYDEPFMKLQTVGLIMAEDGRKMSKRWGNVINPDDVIENVGADTLRAYEMFMGPFDQAVAWSTDGLVGVRKWLEKIYALQFELSDESSDKVKRELHKLIKKVGEDIEQMKFNTAIAAMMSFVKLLKDEKISKEDYITFITLLSPFAPVISQEIYSSLGGEGFLLDKEWPKYDENLAKDDKVTIAIQVNGKVRSEIEISPDASEEEVKELALADKNVQKHMGGKEIKKFIYIPGRIVNIVV